MLSGITNSGLEVSGDANHGGGGAAATFSRAVEKRNLGFIFNERLFHSRFGDDTRRLVANFVLGNERLNPAAPLAALPTCKFHVQYAANPTPAGAFEIPLDTPNLYDELQRKLMELFNDDTLLGFHIYDGTEIIEPKHVNDHFKLSPRGQTIGIIKIIDVERKEAIERVSQNGLELKYVIPRLQNNKGVVLAAVSQNGKAIWSVGPELQNDRDVALAAVSQNGWVLEYVSADFRNDRGVVLAAVSQEGRAIGLASPELQNDRDVVFAAVNQNAWAFAEASPKLQDDREVALTAIAKNRDVFSLASNRLKQDPEIRIAAGLAPL
jgi:hypothetical protein